MYFMYSAVVVYFAFCSKFSVAMSCDFDGTNTFADFNDTKVSITKLFAFFAPIIAIHRKFLFRLNATINAF